MHSKNNNPSNKIEAKNSFWVFMHMSSTAELRSRAERKRPASAALAFSSSFKSIRDALDAKTINPSTNIPLNAMNSVSPKEKTPATLDRRQGMAVKTYNVITPVETVLIRAPEKLTERCVERTISSLGIQPLLALASFT